jgi:hypothetical protein
VKKLRRKRIAAHAAVNQYVEQEYCDDHVWRRSGCCRSAHAESPVAKMLPRHATATGDRSERPGNQLATKKRKGTLLMNGTWGHF